MSYPENPERKASDESKPITIYQGAPGARTLLAQPGDTVKLLYTNWKGNTRERHLQVRELWFGSTQWHAEPQPLLKCLDLEDGAVKDFALSGFRGTSTAPPILVLRQGGLAAARQGSAESPQGTAEPRLGSTLSREELAQALSQAHAAGVKTGMDTARALISTITLTESQANILRRLLGDASTKTQGADTAGGDR